VENKSSQTDRVWTHGDPEALALIAKENTPDELK